MEMSFIQLARLADSVLDEEQLRVFRNQLALSLRRVVKALPKSYIDQVLDEQPDEWRMVAHGNQPVLTIRQTDCGE